MSYNKRTVGNAPPQKDPMADQKKIAPSDNKSISIGGDVRDSNVIIGNQNTVNQTIIQKFFNIFLCRVGGGYIFIHRLLMEHFAEMYVENNN